MADGEVNGDVRELRQMLADCEQYLKEDETPAQRIERERRDTEAVLTLLIREKRKTEELRAEVDRLRHLLDTRPALNSGLTEAYTQWTQLVYASDMAAARTSANDAAMKEKT